MLPSPIRSAKSTSERRTRFAIASTSARLVSASCSRYRLAIACHPSTSRASVSVRAREAAFFWISEMLKRAKLYFMNRTRSWAPVRSTEDCAFGGRAPRLRVEMKSSISGRYQVTSGRVISSAP